ncbi:MAG: ABC transporter substrate-binding protein, partial [Bacteroidaceae bacterium]|nr:ABC transporter substrate-binding protein [Bacteroidaceae bacterium]
IAKAQQMENRQVKLNLRYHDEDKEKLDDLAYRLTHPEEGEDSCHAIIGPYHSDHAQTFLSYAAQTRLPVVMPTCTSAELQRINARNTYAWFLTESDITQCEVLFSAIKTMKGNNVVLLYSDDNYGKSFFDWFNFLATENGLNILGSGAHAYKEGDDLYDFFTEVATEADGEIITVCMALSNPSDYMDVSQQIDEFLSDPPEDLDPQFSLFCADKALSEEVVYSDEMLSFLGVSPVASMNSGFPQVYRQRFGRLPLSGEPQLYDALCLIALGGIHQKCSPDECLVFGKQVAYSSKPYGPGLTDYMRSVVSSYSQEVGQWNAEGLAKVFHALTTGGSATYFGALGDLTFDETTSTKVLNTNYMVWMTDVNYFGDDFNKKVIPICYLSTNGTGNSASTTTIWERTKNFEQTFETADIEAGKNLPDVTDYWAVVISPSTTWSNYRHQADAFAMYQTLRQHGYDDDHIILIVEDNLAYNENNSKYTGQIFVERSDDPIIHDDLVNLDVRKDAKVDYHFSDLTPDDVADIMLGRQSDRLQEVIHPTANSDVFFFWSGHGGSSGGPLWGNEDARSYFGTERIKNIVTQMNEADMYRRLMFAIETCFSGKWGEALTGLPDVLVLTAANPRETSKADVHDRDLGVYLSNAFARTFRKYVNQNNQISLRDLYIELAKTTNGSHVSIYNEHNYGSVYTNTMTDYFPR